MSVAPRPVAAKDRLTYFGNASGGGDLGWQDEPKLLVEDGHGQIELA